MQLHQVADTHTLLSKRTISYAFLQYKPVIASRVRDGIRVLSTVGVGKTEQFSGM